MLPQESIESLRTGYDGVLKGLALAFDLPFIENVRRVATQIPLSQLEPSLNRNQIRCKQWLVDSLINTTDGRLGTVFILGGWHGILAALLCERGDASIETVCSIDLDPNCAPVAMALNRHRLQSKPRFMAVTADMYDVNYHAPNLRSEFQDLVLQCGERPDTVVNTSCEHIADIRGWLELIPQETLLVLQSNDYFGEEGHVNCVRSLTEFRDKAGLQEELFAAALPLRKYTRYMLIGRR